MVTGKNKNSRDINYFFIRGNSTNDYVKYEINNWFYILYKLHFELLKDEFLSVALSLHK